MGRRLGKEISDKITEMMFKNFSDSEAEAFLRKELERYVPQFTSFSDEEIINFIDYQKSLWLENAVPKLGMPIASLNPTFVDSVDGIKVTSEDFKIYTRASVKENGYRFQIHNGPQSNTVLPNVCAFTRQFNPYDLRMFPELFELYTKLPVMIGDAELINKSHVHLAGFNRVQARIPSTRYWPRKDTGKLKDELIMEYLSDKSLFINGLPLEEFELTLAFHGLFAIAHPDTWNSSVEKQIESLQSLCNLPMNYCKVDELLNKLNDYIQERKLNAKVVERKVISTEKELKKYVKDNEKSGLEGTVIVQYAEDEKPSFKFAKSIKIKAYETIDAVLLGIYLNSKAEGLKEENFKGALLGLYDETLGCYLPVCKVNLDPNGVQIKTEGQKERLTKLREELVDTLKDKKESLSSIVTLYDAYVMEAKIKLSYYLKDKIDPKEIDKLFDELPRGQNIFSLISEYEKNKLNYESGKFATKKDQWIHNYRNILSAILGLKVDEAKYNGVMNYFSKFSEIKEASNKLIKPQLIVDASEPVILETQVFDIKWGLNPFPAGFHSWFCDSFHFNNCFAERVRYDKATTTDYATIYDLARKNTIRKKSNSEEFSEDL